MSTKRYLYVPLEIYRRELNGMLLLSLVASEEGWTVVLGGKSKIFPLLATLPEGVVLLKSIVPGELELQEKIIAMGHKVVSLDAEGLLPSNGRSGVELRYGKRTIERSEQLYFWGGEQLEAVKSIFPSVESKAFITGSPVFDYWRFLKRLKENETKKSRSKRVLIATSFPYPNHFIDKEMSYSSVRDASGKDATDDHFNEIFLDGELQNFVYPRYLEIVKQMIKENPDVEIMLRPHPAENPAPWVQLAKGNPNVKLSLTGEISPIILDSDILFHFNSTTSIEAAFYEKHILTYVPNDLAENLKGRLNRHALNVSIARGTSGEVLSTLKELLKAEKGAKGLGLDQIIDSCSSKEISVSSQKIVRALNSVIIPTISRSFPGFFRVHINVSSLKNKVKIRIIWILGWIDFFTGIFRGRYKKFKDCYRYGKSKQGRLDFGDVQKMANLYIEELTKSKTSIKISQIKSGLFVIKKDQNG